MAGKYTGWLCCDRGDGSVGWAAIGPCFASFKDAKADAEAYIAGIIKERTAAGLETNPTVFAVCASTRFERVSTFVI